MDDDEGLQRTRADSSIEEAIHRAAETTVDWIEKLVDGICKKVETLKEKKDEPHKEDR